ncbi:MAG: phage major capsid protein [Candidatus Heimdallarchaeaceae archaeon]
MVKLDRAFDLFMHMYENPDDDYVLDKKKGIVLNRKEQSIVFHKSIQSFMQTVAVKNEEDKIIQAFAGSSDLPTLTKDVFNVTQPMPVFDTLWQESFKGIQLRKGQLEWEIVDVSAGFTFDLIPEGGKIKFYSITGEKTSARIAKYGMGIGITWEMIEGKKLYAFIDMMQQVRAKLNILWADTHYGLLATAAATIPITWQGVTTDPIVERDIATINKGYETIGNSCKEKGYGDTANAPMLIYASPLLKSRIMQALRATSTDVIRGRQAGASGSVAGQIVEYNVIPKFTWNTQISANKAIMVFPGNKIQNAVYLRELGLSEKDIETLNELRTYWTAFGAIVADADQTAELSFV